MVDRVGPRVQYADLDALVGELERVRSAGGWVHSIYPLEDHFQIAYSEAQGDRVQHDFTLPPGETEFLTGAIAAGYLGAHAVNGGELKDVLMRFAIGRPVTGEHEELRIDQGGS